MKRVSSKISCLLFCILLQIFTNYGYARVEESKDECIARYGSPIKELEDGQLLFQKSGLAIIAHFHEGKTDSIAFRKVETNALGKGETISDHEIEILMQNNSCEKTWKKSSAISMNRIWETEDGSLFAHYMNFDNILHISTRGYVDRSDAAKKAKESQALDGL
jgi:hypothetical protein